MMIMRCLYLVLFVDFELRLGEDEVKRCLGGWSIYIFHMSYIYNTIQAIGLKYLNICMMLEPLINLCC